MESDVNIKEGYKKTDVGVIPEEWEVKRINELLIESYLGGNYKNTLEKNFEKNTLPLIKMGNIGRGKICTDTYYSIETKEELNEKHLLYFNDILFNTRNTLDLVGKVAIWKSEYDKAYFNSNLLKLVFDKSKIISSDFINYQLNSYNTLRKLKAVATGTTSVAAIYDKDLKKIQLPIPPLPEQKTIANCLTTWDSGIEKLSALIKAKKEQKRGLMQQLLTGKKRLDGFEGEWKEIKLGEYFKERNERGLNDLELLSVGEQGVYPQSESNKRDTSNEDKTKYKLIEQGDLGYNTMRLWQGRIALSAIRGIVSPAYTIITPKTDKVNSKFFSYFFKMPFVVHLFYKSSQGMVSDTLTCRYNDFKKIKVNVPSKEEQTAIAEVLTIADKEIALLEKKLEGFKEQKRGLMQVLLTGERRLIEN